MEIRVFEIIWWSIWISLLIYVIADGIKDAITWKRRQRSQKLINRVLGG